MKTRYKIMVIQLRSKLEQLKLVWDYLQGMFRYWLYKNHPKYVRKHIKEQYNYRLAIMNPSCLVEHQCVECGCKVPELQMAAKQCGGKCYPPMMDSKKWKKF